MFQPLRDYPQSVKTHKSQITLPASIMISQSGISIPPVRCTEHFTGEPNQLY